MGIAKAIVNGTAGTCVGALVIASGGSIPIAICLGAGISSIGRTAASVGEYSNNAILEETGNIANNAGKSLLEGVLFDKASGIAAQNGLRWASKCIELAGIGKGVNDTIDDLKDKRY